MTQDTHACVFLTDGRCGVHSIRPGFCRIFPLGRLYENHSFRYFIQIHECPAPGKSKIKIRKWIDTPDIKRYEKFVNDWHYYLKPLQKYAMDSEQDEQDVRKLNMYILNQFYLKPYTADGDFYQEFYNRIS